MRNEIKVKIGIIDGLDHIGDKIDFLNEACRGIGLKEDRIGEDAAFGMMLVFNELRDQVDAINKALDEDIHKDEKITLEKVSNEREAKREENILQERKITMETMFKNKSELNGALGDIKCQVAFLEDATLSMCEELDECSAEIKNGIHLTFTHVMNQIDAIDNAIQKNIYEVAEVTIEKEADVG